MKLFKKIATFIVTICSLFALVGIASVNAASTITINYNDTFAPSIPESASDEAIYVHENSGLEFKGTSIYKKTSYNYIMFAQNKGFIYNTKSLGTINSISVTYSGNTSTSAKIGVYFGNDVQGTYTTTSNQTISGKNGTDTFTNDAAGNGYFQISTSNKNCQIVKIEIEYSQSSSTATQLSVPEATYVDNKVNISAVENASEYSIGLFESEDSNSPVLKYDAVAGENVLPTVPQGTYYIKVMANGDNENYLSSSWSQSFYTLVLDQFETKSIAEFLELDVQSSAPYVYYQVTGVIKNIADSTYGNFDLVDPDDPSKSIYVYGLTATKQASNDKSFASLGLKEGHVLTLNGYLGKFNTTFQIQGAYYISHKDDINAEFKSSETKSSLNLTYNSFTSDQKVNLWKAITSLEELEAVVASGEMIMLGNLNHEYVLSTNQKTNNRADVLFETSTESDVQLLTIGKVGNNYTLYCVNGENTGYLCAASSSSNYLRTEAKVEGSDPSTDAQWEITFDETGKTSIVAKGSNTRNVMQYNSGSNLFACYSAAGQSGVYLYRSVEESATEYNFSDVSIRFGTMISAELFDSLVASGSEVKFGVAAIKVSTLAEGNLLDYKDNEKVFFECTPVRVNANGEEDEAGEYYQFALVITGLKDSLDLEFAAACYVSIDGNVSLMGEAANKSIISTAGAYVASENNSSYVEHLDALKYLAGLAA